MALYGYSSKGDEPGMKISASLHKRSHFYQKGFTLSEQTARKMLSLSLSLKTDAKH